MTDRLTIRRLHRHRARCGKPRAGPTPHGWGSLALYVVDADGAPASLPHVQRHIWPLRECRRRAALVRCCAIALEDAHFWWRAMVIPW